MANIAITTYCNLKCPYCFADDMIHTEECNNITIEQLQRILCLLAKSKNYHIGIIGGEPTLHPNFDLIISEISRYCIELNTFATLFTNAINLEKWIHALNERIRILINLNNPVNMTSLQWNDIIQSIEALNKSELLSNQYTIGCNIYPDEHNYNYIWDTVDKYNLQRLRVSVVSPGGKYSSLRLNKEYYYTVMKPIFMEFINKAYDRKVELISDCNQIPDCYFNNDELRKIYSVMIHRFHESICKPVVDITPDFKATACFGCYDPVDCSQFENLDDLERYLLHKKTYPRVQANCTGKCAGCKHHELLTCQGGCLGFANV